MKRAEKLYQDAYDMYIQENFRESIAMCDSALQNHPGDDLAPKFMLLRAYSVARISDEKKLQGGT